jgi:hypothetical protein
MSRGRWALIVGLSGCGGGWADTDTKAATDAVHVQAMIEEICAPDAGECKASQVRALERVAYCMNASMLYRHGQAVPEAGIPCQP